MVIANNLIKMRRFLLWVLFLAGSAVLTLEIANAREASDEPEAISNLESRVQKAKSQALFQIQQDLNMRSILWYRPYGLTIVLTQAPDTPLMLRSLVLKGITTEEIEYHFSSKESELLRQGGVYRVFAVDHLKSDLNLDISVKAVDAERQKQSFSRIFSVSPKEVPAVVEVEVKTLKGDKPTVELNIIGESGSSARLSELFSRHIEFLIKTESYLEAAAILSLVLGAPAKTGDQAKWKLDLATVYLKWNLDEKAGPILLQIAQDKKSEKQSSVAWFYLGKLYYQNGDYSGALETFSEAKAGLRPGYLPEVLYLTGNSFLFQESYHHAVQSFEQVPKSSSFYPYALYSKGLSHLKMGNLDSTRKSFQELIQMDPGSDDLLKLLIDRTHVTFGFFLVDQKMYDQGVEVFSSVGTDSIYQDQAQFGIGWAFLNKGYCDRAAVVFDRLVSEWPYSVYSEEARLKAGSCYSQLGAYRKSVEIYQEALRFYSLQHDTLQSLKQDLNRSSLQDWLTIQREQFVDPKKRNPLIRELASEGGIQQAIAEYEKLLALFDQVDRIAKSTDESLRAVAFKKRLQKLQSQIEEEVKSVLKNRIMEIQRKVEERAIQADIGLLRNFDLDH